jgi:hypothetical protein
LVAVGHYQMVLTYRQAFATTDTREAVGGGYKATLALTGDEAKVTGISSADDAPPASRPAGATDDLARVAVETALQQCAAATTVSPYNCPQSDWTAVGAMANVHWTLDDNPIDAATISFDGKRSLLQASGTFKMHVDYDMTGFLSTHYSDKSSTSHFMADMLWNGSTLEVVRIAGQP